MTALFEGFDRSRYDEEARRRWGGTAAYDTSVTRAATYTADDWKAIEAEHGAVYREAFAALTIGKLSSSPDAMDIAERHRLVIDRWFYPCSHEMHRGLASMYETDDRFRRSIDRHGEGLTTFLVAAIRANADRHGA